MNRRKAIYGCLVGLIIVVCWFFPLFHIRPISVTSSNDINIFSASAGISLNDKSHNLQIYAEGATDVLMLWRSFDEDATSAKKTLGHQSGLGGPFYFCVSGLGTVESISDDRAQLTFEGSERRVCLELGIVVDNTVRDAVGIKASEFTNSQSFNDVSSKLNQQVEDSVIAPNRDRLKEGVPVNFTGCTKINGKSDLDPLCLIPIRLAVQP